MIIEIRGSGGSGKSTIVRRIMARHDKAEPVKLSGPIVFDTLKRGLLYWDGRNTGPAGDMHKAPPVPPKVIGYRLQGPGPTGLCVVGPYETSCGGCDAIPQIDLVYELVRREALAGGAVLFEGRIIGNGSPERTLALHRCWPLVTVHMDVTLETVVAATLERRAAAGRETDEARRANIEKNCRGEIRGAASAARRLGEAGVELVSLGREEALEFIAERLGVAGAPERPLDELGIGVQKQKAQAKLW